MTNLLVPAASAADAEVFAWVFMLVLEDADGKNGPTGGVCHCPFLAWRLLAAAADAVAVAVAVEAEAELAWMMLDVDASSSMLCL